jgi:hypothetical protein
MKRRTKIILWVASFLVIASIATAAIIYKRHHITGTGSKPPTVEWYPESTDFGYVEIGTSITKVVRIKNSGNGVLQGVIALSPDCPNVYTIVSGGGPYSLSKGESKLITIQFEPTDSTATYECDMTCNP